MGKAFTYIRRTIVAVYLKWVVHVQGSVFHHHVNREVGECVLGEILWRRWGQGGEGEKYECG